MLPPQLVFEMSSGGEVKMSFAVGVTVDTVKYRLAEASGLEAKDLSVFHGESLMIDPLSLNDFPFIRPPGPVRLRVAVAGGAGSGGAGGESKAAE